MSFEEAITDLGSDIIVDIEVTPGSKSVLVPSGGIWGGIGRGRLDKPFVVRVKILFWLKLGCFYRVKRTKCCRLSLPNAVFSALGSCY